MTTRLPSWLIAFLALTLIAAGLGWWAYQATATPPVSGTPPVVSTQSPLSSPAIETLRARTIYGDLPVTDESPYTRTDPFVKP